MADGHRGACIIEQKSRRRRPKSNIIIKCSSTDTTSKLCLIQKIFILDEVRVLIPIKA